MRDSVCVRRELSAPSLPLCGVYGMRITVVSPPGHGSVSIWSRLCHAHQCGTRRTRAALSLLATTSACLRARPCSKNRSVCFVLLPKRWVVERGFAWAARFRRLARDYERLATTLAGLPCLAFALPAPLVWSTDNEKGCKVAIDGVYATGGPYTDTCGVAPSGMNLASNREQCTPIVLRL
jgi:hypothetical protein